MVDVYLFSHAIWYTALVLHALNFFIYIQVQS